MATEKRKFPGIQERRTSDGTITYRAQIRVRGFPHRSKTFTRKTDAKNWIQGTEVAIRDGTAVSTEAGRTTLFEALDRYLREITPRKKGARREEHRISLWKRDPLAPNFLSQLRGDDFAKHRDDRRSQGRADNTIRLDLALISHLFEIARKEWGMEGLRNPITNITMPRGSNKRKRRLEPDEETALMAELTGRSPYMRPLAELAIETAMRQGELLALTWRDIDLRKRVACLTDTKNGEPRDVPLSNRAVVILTALPRQIEGTSPVFPLKKSNVIHTFHDACVTAGIENLRFHDLRHEAVSRLFKLGLNPMEVAAISGHKTLQMLKRYTHLKAEDLALKLG